MCRNTESLFCVTGTNISVVGQVYFKTKNKFIERHHADLWLPEAGRIEWRH